ncbi:hypothetical protein GGU11DRAFT_150070 [Lentinula aff. detonsa]|nr:hypothetical protein GGU11DRAFT_150070 [Lentinula aff. detonsa]
MLFSISYVLLGLVTVMHAIPVDSGITYPSRQTAPSHPPHAVAVAVPLLDPRRLQAQLPPPPPPKPKQKIYVNFLNGNLLRTLCWDPRVKKELKLIFEEYRQHLHVDGPFDLIFLDDFEHDGDIHDNFHDVMFWGEGVGGGCQTEREPCRVQYNDPVVFPRVPRPTTHLASVLSDITVTDTTADLFDVTYAMRNRVLSESGHPVAVPNETSLCKVM